MVDRIGGWSVTASKTNLPAVAQKAALAAKQHVVYGMSASFSAAPGAPVLLQLICPDLSPNSVLWSEYVSGPVYVEFLAGICVPIGQSVAAVLAGGGSALVGSVNLHGNTR